MSEAKLKCKECGGSIETSHKFCRKCGAKQLHPGADNGGVVSCEPPEPPADDSLMALRAKARTGDTAAMFELCILHGCAGQHKTAYRLLRLVALTGDVRAQAALGALLTEGTFFVISMLCIFVAMLTAQASGVPIRHFGQGSADEITQCITANTGLNVLVYHGFLRRFLEIQCRRGQPVPDTINQIQQHGFRMLTNDRWAFLVPDELLTGVGWPIKVPWTGLNVNVNIRQASTPSALPLPADLLGSLKEKLVKDAMLIPVVGTDESMNGAVAQIDLRYEIYAYKDAAQNIFLVALLHEGSEIESLARVIFIKLAGAGVELLWDSPLFLLNAYATELEIQDIDGDGHNEIIVRATLEQGAHGGGWQTISIFNDYGEEMTRQPDCKWMRGDFQAGPDRICPIAGESVNLHKNAPGTLIEAVQTPAKGADAVYKLQGGHFVLIRNHRKQLYSPVPR